MSTVQFPLYVGETYTTTLHEIDGTVVQANATATEVAPGAFNTTFATVPNGFYRIVVSDADGALFTDTVVINAANTINIVTSEARTTGSSHSPADVVIALLQHDIGSIIFPSGSVGKAIQDTFKDGDIQHAQELDTLGDDIPGSFVTARVTKS